MHGDIARFLAGDPTRGSVHDRLLPDHDVRAAGGRLAIAHCARPERRKVVGGMMISLALTSFVTGVTEPIEFTFMFIAPVLYAIHAVLTGVSMARDLGARCARRLQLLGRARSTSCLNWHLATKPWLIIPIGLCFAVIYYVVFRFAITKFNLPTPGREPDEEVEELQKAEAK